MLTQLITSHSAETGLVLFVLSFITITVYAITRSRRELDHWSGLPLNEAPIPVERTRAREKNNE